jgi:proteasome accessory factor B
VSRARTERLVNLVICLLATRRFLTAAQIAATVAGYQHDPDDPRAHEAFQRKFERDKAELRALGVPLETGTDSIFDAEPGYRIARREYALPDLRLQPDEAAVVGLAARLWQHAGLAAAASSGLTKLRAAGVDLDPHATLGVVCWRSRWYVVGHDLDRDDTRCFRLSRLVGAVHPVGPAGAFEPPAGVDLISHVARWSGPVERHGRATVLVRPGHGDGLRRWAERVEPGPDGDVVTLAYHCAEELAHWLVGYGAHVRVLDPPEVRDAAISRLKEITASVEPAGATTAAGEPAR